MTHVAVAVEQCWERVPGGSATYLLGLLAALRDETDVRTTGLAAAHRHPPAADLVPPGPVRSSGLPRYLLYRAWQYLGMPRAEWVVPDADVVHAPTWAIPATRRPLVVTVQDLAFLREPEHFTPRGVRFFEAALARTRDEAAAVIVPSEATAADCREHGIEDERLHVIPYGGPGWQTSADELVAARVRLGLPDRFVLWCGTAEPRKNLGGLLAGFAELATDEPDLHLLLVGPRGWGEEVEPPDGPWRSRVRHLGRVPADDLRLLYAAATAFAFPSFWEGFGFPVLEAMTMGTPVVTSRATSMAEIVGPTGILVDPQDPAGIAAGLRRAVGPEGPRIGSDGRSRAAAYTWGATARAHAEVYSSVM